MTRLFSALPLVLVMVTGLSAQDLVQLDASAIRPGQALVIELTGNAFKDYARCCNIPDDVKGVSFCVLVQQVLDDGQFVVEYSKQIASDDTPDRLVTFATTVDPTMLERYHARGVRLRAVKPNLEPDESQPDVEAPNTAVLRLADSGVLKCCHWRHVE